MGENHGKEKAGNQEQDQINPVWTGGITAVGTRGPAFNIFQADSYSPDDIRRFSEERKKPKWGLSPAAFNVEIDHPIQHKDVVENYQESQPFAIIMKRFGIKFP
jgi:hypothetical protein